MYPAASCPMDRYWVDVCLDRYNGMTGAMADDYMSNLGPGYKEYEKNAMIFYSDDGKWNKYLSDLNDVKTANGCKNYIVGDCITLVDTATFGNFYKALLNKHMKAPHAPMVHEAAMKILKKYPALCEWWMLMCADEQVKAKILPMLNKEKWEF